MKKIIIFTLVLISFLAKANYWTQKASFPGIGRGWPFSFVINNKGYIGCGLNATGLLNDFWEYDPILNTWTQKVNFGGVPRFGSTGIAIGNKGYAGLGIINIGVGIQTSDFWEYDPVLNIWTQKINFGGGTRYVATGFSIGTKGYIGFGAGNNSTVPQDLWEYEPLTNLWSAKANLPQGRTQAVSFTLGGKGYISGGNDSGSVNILFDLWEYDAITDTWAQKANFPGTPRVDAASFSICNSGYIGIGDLIFSNFINDLWKYDPMLNQWAQKANFLGTSRDEAAFFAIGDKGYIGLGGENPYYNDLWEYTDCATGISEVTEYISLNIFPIPFNNKLTLIVNSSSLSEIILFDISSKKVLQHKFTNSVTLNTEQLAKGMYLYEVRNKNGVVKKGRVVKE